MAKGIMILLALLALTMPKQLVAGDPVELDAFHSIVVSSEINAEIVLSEEESIELDFKNAEEENLIIEVVDSVLNLRMKTGNYKDASLKVKIYYIRDLKLLEASVRAQIWSREYLLYYDDLTVDLSNGGEMRFYIECDSLSATLSQGAIIHLQGKTRALKVKCSTNGTFSGYDFKSEIADVSAGSTGKAKVNVSKSLKANAGSKGFIGYLGDPPKVDKKTSLMGEITKAVQEE